MSRRLRLVRRATLAVLVIAVVVFGGSAYRVWSVAREDHRSPVDAIVVLGTAQFDGRPSQIFQARLEHAARLYADRVAPTVVTVGGGRPGDRFTEAGAGAIWLREHGVPASAVVEVAEGRDTVSSLRAARRAPAGAGWDSIVLVTDPWHSLRARAVAREAGFRAQTSPARSGPAVRTRTTQIRYITRESFSYIHFWVFRRGSGDARDAA